MEKKANNRVPIVILVGIAIMLIISTVWNTHEQNILDGETKTTVGTLTKIVSGTGVRQIPEVQYWYQVNKVWYSGSDNVHYSSKKIGDTILIEYSVKDHSISCVMDK